MPKFDFFCKSCGLLFDKLVADSSVTKATCLSCKQEAEKHFIPHKIGITYKNGLPPTASIDQIVGSDADIRWNKIESRKSQANKARETSKSPVLEVNSLGEIQAASDKTVAERKSVAKLIVDNK